MWLDYFSDRFPNKFDYDIKNYNVINGIFNKNWIDGKYECMKISKWCNLAIQYLLNHPDEKFIIYPVDSLKCGASVGISVKKINDIVIKVSFKTSFNACDVIINKKERN